MKRSSRGFSLMELMVVLSLAGVIVAVAAPSFNRFRANSRLTNTANDLLGTLMTARTDAIKTQTPVSICTSANPTDPAATCTYGSTVGWISFRETNGNCIRETGEVRVGGGVFDQTYTADPLRIRTNGNCTSFGPNGFTRTVAGVAPLTHILACDSRGVAAQPGTANLSAGRGIVVDRTGRSRVTRTVTGGLAEDLTTWASLTGVTLTCP